MPTEKKVPRDDDSPSKMDVGAFIASHVKPCDEDLDEPSPPTSTSDSASDTSPSSRLSPPTPKTAALWRICTGLMALEFSKGGVLGVDTTKPSNITAHGPGYIDGDGTLDDVVVGLQCETPLTRAMKPLGGVRLLKRAVEEQEGCELPPAVEATFRDWRRTHNDVVFGMYTPEMRAARKNHIITGLPDTYGRGRIIGDYRRVALYGVDAIIAAKQADKRRLAEGAGGGSGVRGNGGGGRGTPTSSLFVTSTAAFSSSADPAPNAQEDRLRNVDEVAQQIGSLEALKVMGASYGCDLGRPATDAREAVQWTYLAYLAVLKDHDGAAISLGRLDGFFDVYIERDIAAGALTEEGAQELIDHLVIKLRLVRHLRPKAYDEIFAGDPVWATCCIGGCQLAAGHGGEATHMVTKTSWRFLHSLANLGPAPEPNMTVLWDERLPVAFKRKCARTSIDTSSIQYINDALMRETYESDDYGISCCVSGMRLGRDMQFFGARCNLPKLLLYALNGGRDEVTGAQVAPPSLDAALGEPVAGYHHRAELVKEEGAPLVYEEVVRRLGVYMDWLVGLYVDINNIIHWSHDKYYYEAIMMGLIDTDVHRDMAFGVAGLSVIADSLSAIKHAAVTPARSAVSGLTTGFHIRGEFPCFGNDDDRVDAIAADLVRNFADKLRTRSLYRGAEPTLSVLTITSNVMYGKHTGATPDGRAEGAPYAPGANPMHRRDTRGALSSLNSVAKVPYGACKDGISNTFSIPAPSLGKSLAARCDNLAALLDGYFDRRAQHLNVNVMSRETLVDAMNHPAKYPALTIRVSGYAVNFNRLSREHQEEVIARTFHATV